MKSFEQKAKDYFGEIVINKYLINKAGFGNRAIPKYVGEWIISYFNQDEFEISDDSREKISEFVLKYIPQKSEKESVKNRLLNQQEVKFLDNFSVYINLAKGDRYLNIPFLDEYSSFITPSIVEENTMLLSSGLWGVGTLFYIPPSDDNPRGQIWMKEFKPFQTPKIDIEFYCDCRKNFNTDEWIDLIVSSMGFNPDIYSEKQKIYLIERIIPLVESRFNLIELAPKGTGKSFVYDNSSNYIAVRSGSITPAVLFFNDSRKTPGLITRYDCVVIDEAQKLRTDSSGELTALLKSYLESGKFGKGSANAVSAESGIVILANIEIDNNNHPLYDETGLLRVFPNFLRETAFIDRMLGLLPGWELPRTTKETPSKYLGFKGDIFAEILHSLRNDISYKDYVKQNMELKGCEDMRDTKAIESGASALLKIIFPNKEPSEEEFYKYCVNPAVELRQRIRDELTKLDREYKPVSIKSKYPDPFQIKHQIPQFKEIEETKFLKEKMSNSDKSEILKENIPEEENNKLIEKSIIINEGDTGFSYKSLFYPYLKSATKIKIVDPYIRLEHQIRNLMIFCEMFSTDEDEKYIHLLTRSENPYFEEEVEKKLSQVKENLTRYGIILSFEFDKTIHDRFIESDNGWKIKLGRGLDFYQKPENFYDISEFNQTKKKCHSCEIDFKKL